MAAYCCAAPEGVPPTVQPGREDIGDGGWGQGERLAARGGTPKRRQQGREGIADGKTSGPLTAHRCATLLQMQLKTSTQL